MKQCLIAKITTILDQVPVVANLARKKFVVRFVLALCYLHQKVQKIKTKRHGYKRTSFSRHGLNFFQQFSRPQATLTPQITQQLALAARWLIRQIIHYQSTKIMG